MEVLISSVLSGNRSRVSAEMHIACKRVSESSIIHTAAVSLPFNAFFVTRKMQKLRYKKHNEFSLLTRKESAFVEFSLCLHFVFLSNAIIASL